MKQETIYVEENNCEYDIYIGENKYDNVEIIKMSSQNDTWFHLNNFSSAHIVLRNNGDKIPKKYIKEICAKFSYNKKGLPKRYTVIIAQIKNIKLTDKIGEVVVKKSEKITI